ncbi:hypothetical protein EVAR_36328_1 [Eumeta japonica]|uniref:Uncharacterized protein n=1 Tax=Eumeta variegata TaxID=151549 RepID=A0A4C1VKW8_EUMVA|nr:hypothetical protein EVAR_36328_1 [Eumeta japonica]
MNDLDEGNPISADQFYRGTEGLSLQVSKTTYPSIIACTERLRRGYERKSRCEASEITACVPRLMRAVRARLAYLHGHILCLWAIFDFKVSRSRRIPSG